MVLPMTATIHEASEATFAGGHLYSERSTPPPQEANSRPPDSEIIHLSSEQKKVLELVRTGRNVFFTGPAGTFSLF
jgi:ATP-dependent DNA helicase PIF1